MYSDVDRRLRWGRLAGECCGRFSFGGEMDVEISCHYSDDSDKYYVRFYQAGVFIVGYVCVFRCVLFFELACSCVVVLVLCLHDGRCSYRVIRGVYMCIMLYFCLIGNV